jgi:serine-type D-Ala-D-Ala carboxypeptidase/endopeptidase
MVALAAVIRGRRCATRLPAAGGIRSSAHDLLRLLAACLAPSDPAPGPAMTLATRPRMRAGRRLEIGLGWMILHRPRQPGLIFHRGGAWGFRSFAASSPPGGSVSSSSPTRPGRWTGSD